MKKILTLLLSVGLFFNAFSQPVDRETALQVATNFWTSMTNNSSIVHWNDVGFENGFENFYFFENTAGKGFVIVSANKCVQPILGYSLSNKVVTPLPSHIFSFLQKYENEIDYYIRNSSSATDEIIQQWNNLINNSYTTFTTTSVEPLLTTTWGQRPLYNNLCPDSAGVHAPTGCVATATAQVMKYWNWPTTGQGSYSYTYNDTVLSANFANTTYDWAQMPNSLNSNSSADEINAVATLMYHIGVAIEMNYEMNGSSAILNSYDIDDLPCAENALKNYFRYKESIHSLYKDETSDADWIAALKAELNAGRPVLERGSGEGGGHAFVCDGYDATGLFHINWGWSGYMDGYFAHNALNPNGGGTGSNTNNDFNEHVAIIVGIEPKGKLFCHPDQLSFIQEGGSNTFTITPNSTVSTSWQATSSQSWLSLTPSSGNSSSVATITATAAQNNTGSARTATITVTQGNQSYVVTVQQKSCSASDLCTVTLEMTDSYGDGWNGAHITVSSLDGFIYGTATCDGNSSSQQFSVCPSDLVLSWNPGNYDSECAFSLVNNTGEILLTVDAPPTNSYTITSPCNTSSQIDTGCTVISFPWNESFENDLSCWSTYDNDGDGNNWFLASGVPQNGTYSMASYSYNQNLGGSLHADNYLITPDLAIPSTGSYELSFYSRCANSNYPDSIMVKLATSEVVSTSDFTITLLPITQVSTTYQKYTISLADYSGQTIKIAFIHQSFDGTYLLLDNISIVNTAVNYTINITSANNTMGTACCSGNYAGGTSIDISATANTGFRFTSWNDGISENPRAITVSQNQSFIANFDDLGDEEHHYDNGEFARNMGANGSLYWGIRFLANELLPYETLSSVKIFDKEAGNYDIFIYQGGENAPGTLITSQTVQLTGTNDWHTFALNSPVSIDHSQPLWIVVYNSGVSYPAAASNYAGNPEGSWLSIDGNSWAHVTNYGYFVTWMIRAVLEEASTPPQQYQIIVYSDDYNMGNAMGGGFYNEGETIQIKATPASHHHFTHWNDNNTQATRNVVVSGDATYIAYFAKNQYQITVVSANPSMGTVEGNGSYEYGSVVQIKANPLPNHEFVSWTDGNTENPRDVTVLGVATYIAQFQSTIGIDDIEKNAIKVYSLHNRIIVESPEELSVQLFDITGKLIAENNDHTNQKVFTVDARGIYLVRCSDGSMKKVQVIR